MLRADLHVHSVLSPCGDIEMTPSFIIGRAVSSGLNVVAITDHNTTRQAPVIQELGRQNGIFVVAGAEITTREEVHVLALVGTEEARLELQGYLDRHIMKIRNKPEVFGYQVAVDENECVFHEEEYLLINSIDRSIEDIENFVHSLGGIFIPAHIDKTANSLFSQLGYLPPELKVEALEVSPRCNMESILSQYPYLKNIPIITSSDAHYPNDFGKTYTVLDMPEPTFECLKESFALNPVINQLR